MSETDQAVSDHVVRKHRHDGPDVAHHAEATIKVTAVIQVLLGLCLVATGGLVIYALVAAV